jgi:hypothetical protein
MVRGKKATQILLHACAVRPSHRETTTHNAGGTLSLSSYVSRTQSAREKCRSLRLRKALFSLLSRCPSSKNTACGPAAVVIVSKGPIFLPQSLFHWKYKGKNPSLRGIWQMWFHKLITTSHDSLSYNKSFILWKNSTWNNNVKLKLGIFDYL